MTEDREMSDRLMEIMSLINAATSSVALAAQATGDGVGRNEKTIEHCHTVITVAREKLDLALLRASEAFAAETRTEVAQ